MKNLFDNTTKSKRQLVKIILALGAFSLLSLLIAFSIYKLSLTYFSKADITPSHLYFMPENLTCQTGEICTVSVYLLPQSNAVIGVDAVLNYDPSFVSMISIEKDPASLFPAFFSTIEDTSGKAEFSALAFDNTAKTLSLPVTGDVPIKLANISLNAKASGNSNISLVYTGSGEKNDSNIVVASETGIINDVLASPLSTVVLDTVFKEESGVKFTVVLQGVGTWINNVSGNLSIFRADNPSNPIFEENISFDSQGCYYSDQLLTQLTPEQNYIFSFKGNQHLRKSVIVEYAQGVSVDFGTLLAGDVYLPNEQGSQDGEINSGDFSALVERMWGSDSLYDLNADGEINSGDLSLIISNWFKKDD